MENEVEIKGSLKRFKIDGEYYQYDYAGLANKPDLVTREELEAYDVSKQLTGLLPKIESTYAIPHNFNIESDATKATLGFETITLDGTTTTGTGSIVIPSATKTTAGLLSAEDKETLDRLDEEVGYIKTGRVLLENFDFDADPSDLAGDYIVKGAVNGPDNETDGLLTVMHSDNDGIIEIIETWTGTKHTGYRVLRVIEGEGNAPAVPESLTINGTTYRLDTEVTDFDANGVKYKFLEEPISTESGEGLVRRLYLHAGGEYTLSGNVSNMQIIVALTSTENSNMETYATQQKNLYDSTDGAQGSKKPEARKFYIESQLEYKSTKVTLDNFTIKYADGLENTAELDEMAALLKYDLDGGKLKVILKEGSHNKFVRTLTRETVNASAGTIFSNTDLIIAGLGFLSIVSMGGEHAIKAKGDLKFFDKPHVYIETAHDAIHGNSGVYIENGFFYVEECNDVFGSDTLPDDGKIGKVRLYAGELDVINCVETILQADDLIVFDGFKVHYKNVGDGLFKESPTGTNDHTEKGKKKGEYTLDPETRMYTYTAFKNGAPDGDPSQPAKYPGIVVLPGAEFQPIEDGVVGSSAGGDVNIEHARKSPAEVFGEGHVLFDNEEVSANNGVYTLPCPAGETDGTTLGHIVKISGYIEGSFQFEAFKVEVQLSDAYIVSTNAPVMYYTQDKKALQIKTLKEDAQENDLPLGASILRQTGTVDSSLKAPGAISSNKNIRTNGDGLLIVSSNGVPCLNCSEVTLDGDGNKYFYGFDSNNQTILGTELYLGRDSSSDDAAKNNKGSIYCEGIVATRLSSSNGKGFFYFYHDNFGGLMFAKNYFLVPGGSIQLNDGTNNNAFISAETPAAEALRSIIHVDADIASSSMPLEEVSVEEEPAEDSEPVYDGTWVFGVSESAFIAYQSTMNSIITNLKTISIAPEKIFITKKSKLDENGAITEVIEYKDNKGKELYGTGKGELTVSLAVGEKIRLYGLIKPDNVTNSKLKWKLVDGPVAAIVIKKSDDSDYCDVTGSIAGSQDLNVSTDALTENFEELKITVHFIVTEPVVEPTPEEPVVNGGE